MADGAAEQTRGGPGRRPAGAGARDDILDAAAQLFSEQGFEAASVRGIASRAGVDPALIRHYFGDKSGLFLEVLVSRVELPTQLIASLHGDVAHRGERLTRAYLGVWEDEAMRGSILLLFRAMVAGEGALPAMQAAITELLGPLGSGLPEADARQFGLAITQLVGVAIGRYVLAVPLFASLTMDELVALVAPSVQSHLEKIHFEPPS